MIQFASGVDLDDGQLKDYVKKIDLILIRRRFLMGAPLPFFNDNRNNST
jgi:hypothetical protein